MWQYWSLIYTSQGMRAQKQPQRGENKKKKKTSFAHAKAFASSSAGNMVGGGIVIPLHNVYIYMCLPYDPPKAVVISCPPDTLQTCLPNPTYITNSVESPFCVYVYTNYYTIMYIYINFPKLDCISRRPQAFSFPVGAWVLCSCTLCTDNTVCYYKICTRKKKNSYLLVDYKKKIK